MSRVHFVIKTVNAEDVRALLKTALHDSPKAFVKHLILNGMSDVTGVKEVPVDNSSVRKVLESTEAAGRLDYNIEVLLVVCGFLGTLALAASCYAVMFRKHFATDKNVRYNALTRTDPVPHSAVRSNARSRRKYAVDLAYNSE